MHYEAEWKPTKTEDPDFKCSHCNSDDVHFREWNSSCGGHVDYRYKCSSCGNSWWAEGSDA